MGQQQLLLIALGVIVVGIAVVIGIQLMGSSAVQANRDALSLHLATLGAMAQKHYNNPRTFGGGGETFANFIIPPAMAETEHGTYEHTQTEHGTDHIHFTGTGIEKGDEGNEPISIEIRITEFEFTWTTLN